LDFGFWIVERLQSASFKNPSVTSIIQIGFMFKNQYERKDYSRQAIAILKL
jgi:hypothetical protein